MEAKYARGTLTIFNIVDFTLLIYEVPFISVPSSIVQPINLQTELKALTEDNNRIDQLALNIEVMNHGVYRHDYMPYKQLTQDALKETLLWYASEYEKEEKSKLYEKLEAVMMSVLYKSKISSHENYHWHLFFGDIVHYQKDSPATQG